MCLLKSCLLFLVVSLVGCSSADPDLWPPKINDENKIAVYCDGFHSVVVLPGKSSPWLEYNFAEELWYMENSQGCLPSFRAMLYPSSAVLEVGTLARLPVADKDVRVWHYTLSSKGLAAMRAYIENIKSKKQRFKSSPSFPVKHFNTRQSYHLFYTCNTFTAKLLKAGGLPINSFWVVTNDEIVERLDELSERIKK